MNHLDFLSPSPTIYFFKKRRGKNALGGFFSILFFLSIIALVVYYIYIYFYGMEYTLMYYSDNWTTFFTNEQIEHLKKPKSFVLYILKKNNAKITPLLYDYYNMLSPAKKCKVEPFSSLTDEVYCLDLVFPELNKDSKQGNIALFLRCDGNCTDSQGEPIEMEGGIFTANFKIDHKREEPLIDIEVGNGGNGYGISFNIKNVDNYYVKFIFGFNTIMYNSTAVLNTKTKTYIKTYLATLTRSMELIPWTESPVIFTMNLNTNCDIYIREYRTLLDTLSKIGGLFAPIKLLFEVLIFFYSDLEINSEITKSVFAKIKDYEYKPLKNIHIEKNLENIDTNISNEKKEIRKKLKVIKCEEYFCSFFNCCCCFNLCKSTRTMRLLNLFSDFVQTNLSAENIIFNMLLFESYYKDNPIKFKKYSFLNQINKVIENDKNLCEEEEESDDKNEKKEKAISLVHINEE